MTPKPIASALSILFCPGIPAATWLTVNDGVDGHQQAMLVVLSVVIASMLGLITAAIGCFRKEQPRWCTWIALALNATVILGWLIA